MNIGITGTMRAGKTTLANTLVEQYGYEKMSLAEPLKLLGKGLLHDILTELDYVAADIGHDTRYIRTISDERLEQDKAVFRPFWQWLGTEFCRNYVGWETLWVDILLYRLKNATKPVVIDDVRFLNEAQALKEQGFTIVRVIRTGGTDDGQAVVSGDPTIQHASETELEAIPYDHIYECADVGCLARAAEDLIAVPV